MYDLLIRNCLVLQCERDQARVLPGRDLLIDQGRILDLQPTGVLSPAGCRDVLEARGRLAMPGLINTHAHVPMVLFRGLAEDVGLEAWFNEYMWPLESNLQPDDVYWGMLLGLVEMIEAGVTAVADHYFHMDLAARAVEQAGTRAALGWAIFGSQGRDALERSAGFIERHQGAANGRITTWMAPHAPYTCDDAFLSACASRAEELGVGIHIHVAETRAQTDTSLKTRGLTPIQILERTGVLDRPCILAHACGVIEEDLAILAEKPCGVAHAPKTYLKLAMGIAPVARLRRAGVPVGLATDGACSSNTLDIWESLRLTAMLQKHETGCAETLTIPQALTIATRDSARVLGLGDSLGHLAPGFLADLILVDLSGAHHQPLHDVPTSLVYSARASDVETVIVAGQILMRDRELLTLSKKDILDNVRKSMERLTCRVPDRRIQVYSP